MFGQLPKTRVIADPFCQIYALAEYCFGNFNRKEIISLLKNIYRLQGKPLKKVNRYSC